MNRQHRFSLQQEDVQFHRWNLVRFRNHIARSLGLEPANDADKTGDRLVRLGYYWLSPGKEYPVYWLRVNNYTDFQGGLLCLTLKRKSPFFLLTGTRADWDTELQDDMCERNSPLLALSEILDYRDGQFLANDAWHGAVEMFRQTLHPVKMVTVPPFEFRKKGQLWVVRYDGQELFLKDNDGPRYMAMLLANPGHSFFAIDMHQIAAGYDPDTTVRPNSGGDLTDRQTFREAEEQSRKLLSELDQARRDGDRIRKQEILDEIEKLANYLCETKGFGGRLKKNSSPTDSIRRSIQQLIKGTIKEIEKESVECAKHFRKSITTGYVICYDPSSEIYWSL